MIIGNKKLLIFPEYHLTDFPPQVKMSSDEARTMLMMYSKYGFDILIAGYVEIAEENLYSSCLIIDESNTFNIRKRYPYNDENKIIIAWHGKNSPVELSIGKSYFLLCNDLNKELDRGMDLIQNIENFFLISAMFNNFEENIKSGIAYCKQYNVKRFIYADRFNGIKQQEIYSSVK